MDSLVERIFAQYAKQQTPSWRQAYMDDVMMHTQVNSTRNTLDGVERAMRAEGLPEETIRRVLRRVVLGDPEDPPGEDA